MVARNNITGDKLQSKKNSSEYEDNWELIWGKKKKQTHDILRPTTKWEGEPIKLDWDESRIDTIGQNGNEGDHYDQVEGPESTPNKPLEPT